MLPILLSILKIAGIALLALLGVICLLVFTVLVIPVRYGLSGSYGESVRVKARVTWLLHAVSAAVTYEEELNVSVRILGIRLFGDSGWGKPEEAGEEPGETPGDPLLISSWEKQAEVKQAEKEQAADGRGREERADPGEAPGEAGVSHDPLPGGEKDETGEGFPKARGRKAGKKKPESPGRDGGGAGNPGRLVNSAKEKWNRLRQQKEKAETFIRDEKNRQTFRLLLRQFKKLIRHLMPTKVRGKAVIGFEDPAVTGKVLSLLAVLYAWYGDSIEISPVFHEPVFEVEGTIKGRVRAGTLLLCCVRVLLNKNFRSLVRKFMKEWR